VKVRIVMKTPDCLEQAFPLDDGEEDKFWRTCRKYFKYQESIVLEIDLEKETIVVLPV
jgi:hypothetical protein